MSKWYVTVYEQDEGCKGNRRLLWTLLVEAPNRFRAVRIAKGEVAARPFRFKAEKVPAYNRLEE